MTSKAEKQGKKAAFFLVLAILVVFAFFLGNVVGTMHIRPKDVFDAVRGGIRGEWISTEAEVVWNIRLPRMILACLVGINLALSGCILQGVMKNPLADPGIIGISAGPETSAPRADKLFVRVSPSTVSDPATSKSAYDYY